MHHCPRGHLGNNIWRFAFDTKGLEGVLDSEDELERRRVVSHCQMEIYCMKSVRQVLNAHITVNDMANLCEQLVCTKTLQVYQLTPIAKNARQSIIKKAR
jgi:hypothetical protein